MNLSGNTIIITGGATGIGFELAKQFTELGNTVIICGRREEKLREAKEECLSLHTLVCNVGNSAGRKNLFETIRADFPELNILINNAGIQQYLNFLEDTPSEKIELETSINLDAPIHLSSLFIPHLMTVKNPAIMNVTSGLAFVPRSLMPVYCATKAALHSFSMTLRVQLHDTPIKVFELVPPIVDTELDRGERKVHGITDRGISAEQCAKEMIGMIEANLYFAPVERAKNMFAASRSEQFDAFFVRMNGSSSE
jgi:uncharacterized oxidoreductase